MWIVLGVVILGLATFIIFFPRRYLSRRTMKLIHKIPGPPGLPYLGNALEFTLENHEFIPHLVKLLDQYKPVYKFVVLGTPFVFMSELDDIESHWPYDTKYYYRMKHKKERIFLRGFACPQYCRHLQRMTQSQKLLNSRNHITKGVDYDFLLPWLGSGLLISNGQKWFDHRKWLTPAFHFAILEQYVDIMNKNANILCNILKTHDKVVEINPLINYCALDIICETAMGTEVNAQLDGEKNYVKSIFRMSQIFTKRNLSPWLYRTFVFHLSPLGREHAKNLKIVHGFSEKVIKERKAAYKASQAKYEKHSYIENNEDLIGGKKKMSFLDLLIEISETQNRLTEEEIREEVDTFMFEGHDTTATSTSWALFELGLNPQIQEKAYREQVEIFGNSDRQATSADLQEMKYLERIIKETLRLYPSVPIISRTLTEDIDVKGYTIPAEAQVPIFIYYIHRNPEIYPDPEKFDPDRFLPELMRYRHPFSYIPFSAGPRNCIGQKFAMMEEKLILSQIIRKFKFTSIDKRENVVLMGEVTLRPKNNLKILFETR